jgi:outer membrane protein assembly factor BamB
MSWARFPDGGNAVLVYFAGSRTSEMLDTRTGKVLRREKDLARVPYGPLLTASATYYPTVGGVNAYDETTDKLIWRFTADSADAVAAGLLLVDGALCFAYGDAVLAVDARTGARRWRRVTEGTVAGGLTARGATLFATTDAGVMYALNTGTGAVEWTFRRQLLQRSTPPVALDLVHAFTSDTVWALDVAGPRWERW